MRPAVETLFQNVPKSLRVFPEDDPEAIAIMEELRHSFNEEQDRLFMDFLNQSNRLTDEQAFCCFAMGLYQGLSLGQMGQDKGEYAHLGSRKPIS